MIEHTLDKVHSILYVRPQSKLEQADFEQLAERLIPTSKREALSPVSSSRSLPFQAGTASAPWRAIFALCAIITSTSKRSAL